MSSGKPPPASHSAKFSPGICNNLQPSHEPSSQGWWGPILKATAELCGIIRSQGSTQTLVPLCFKIRAGVIPPFHSPPDAVRGMRELPDTLPQKVNLQKALASLYIVCTQCHAKIEPSQISVATNHLTTTLKGGVKTWFRSNAFVIGTAGERVKVVVEQL